MSSAQLEITGGPDAGQIIELQDKPLTVGRAPGNALRLQDDTASRQHAKVFFRGGKYLVLDLRSSHGTWVNGERVSQHTLSDNDEIKVGSTTFRFQSVGAVSVPEPILNENDDDEPDGGFELEMPAGLDAPPATDDTEERAGRSGTTADGEDPFADDEDVPPLPQSSPSRPTANAAGGGVGTLYRPNAGKAAAGSRFGVLGHDLDQRGPGFRYFSMAVVIAIAIGLGWVAMKAAGFGSDEVGNDEEVSDDSVPRGLNRPVRPDR